MKQLISWSKNISEKWKVIYELPKKKAKQNKIKKSKKKKKNTEKIDVLIFLTKL